MTVLLCSELVRSEICRTNLFHDLLAFLNLSYKPIPRSLSFLNPRHCHDFLKRGFMSIAADCDRLHCTRT